MDIVKHLAPYFEPYFTVTGVVPGRTYDYAARGVFGNPVLATTMHRDKIVKGEWLYVAVPESASLRALAPDQRLYVGSETLDRMFRGDGMGGRNLHHREMRKGNGPRNLVSYLKEGGRVRIHLIGRSRLELATKEVPELHPLARLVDEPKIPRLHAGARFEHAILHREPGRWQWNTAGAHGEVGAFLNRLGL